MCEDCRAESDEQYEGSSIEEKRTKAIQSVAARHPELGIDPEEVVVRFVSKAEERCVRINAVDEWVRFEIHLPAYTGVAASGTPPLGQLAQIAWVRSELSYDEVCETLSVSAEPRFDALFLSASPPIDPPRADAAAAVREYESQGDRTGK